MTVALHYTVDGLADAPPLLLGASLGTSTRLWDRQIPSLSQRFRVVRYDHRGHGLSPVPAGPYDLADLGRDVLALMDHLDIPRAHFAGVSLGGMVSMWVAIHAPARVDRLALVCTSARAGPASAWAQRAATVRADGIGAIADAVVGRWTPPDYAATHPETVAWLRGMLTSTPTDGYAACCGAIETMDLEPDLPRVSAPTLAIAGTEDQAIAPAHSERIVSLIPGARLELVTGAAHLPMVSRPELIPALIADFLYGDSTDGQGDHHE